jgi:acyl-CoA synthetase (NDP forming)
MSYKRLLQPSSIAVYGGSAAQELVRQCDLMGYKGDIWPVHPSKTEIRGRKVYRSTEELPAVPDAAYIAVNRHASIDIVRELATRGTGGVVCYATGFIESGEAGAELQTQLLEASGDMPMIGPNCYGLLNYVDGAMLWPDQQGGRRVENGVAIITMSSNVGFNLTMQRRGLQVAYMVSLGNRLKFDIHDAIRAFANEERVSAIGLYLETVGDPVLFEEAVAVARELGKPLVALKVGRSEISKKMVVSHTSSLAGSDDLIAALFERTGVARVNSLEELVEALKVLHVLGPLKGGRLGVMSTSGGDLSLISDSMEGSSLNMPALTDAGIERIRPTVHERIVVANPLDYQMFDWNNEERLSKTFSAFLAEDFDIFLSLLDYPRADKCDPSHWSGAERAFINAANKTGAAAAIMATFTDTLPEPLAEQLLQDGIVPLAGIYAGLAGIQAAVDVGTALGRPPNQALLTNFDPYPDASLQIKDEAESKSMLARYGVPVPKSRLVSNAREAVAAAHQMGYPVVLKALGVAHKTDVGGVALNLLSDEEIVEAVVKMNHLCSHFLVEAMVEGVIAELIVGVARDSQFGPHLVVGSGGILVEMLKDSKSLLLPVTRKQVIDALEGLKCAPLLHGFRGKAPCDIAAAADVVLAIAAFVEDNLSTIAEVDINPLMLLAEGHGVVAGDALISMYVNKQNGSEIETEGRENNE